MNIVALIPARRGSKRVPEKNFRLLGGKPAYIWTIDAAQQSGIFTRIVLASDDPPIHTSGRDFDIMVRPTSEDNEPDIAWVHRALNLLNDPTLDAFAILRPTSPFRTAETIRRAWHQFVESQPCDSLRAVEPATQHPGKMWEVIGDGRLMVPLLKARWDTPWHSLPTQTLPTYYRQNASLEIAWVRTVRDLGTIAGNWVAPFHTEGWEGFDINTPEDWDRAERHMADLQAAACHRD